MFTNLRSAATGSTAASILSKLKSDFGITTATNEKANLSSTNLAGTLTAPVTRVISLPLPAQSPVTQKASVADPTLFLDLTQALKESIIGALDDIVREREDAVRKGEASMRIPGGSGGWNWNKFFACKESLALTYERMSLFEDALLTYDELEASMAQVARGQSPVLDFCPLHALMGPIDHRYLGLRGSDGYGKDCDGHCAAVPARKLCEKSLPISVINVYDIRVPRVSVPPAGRDPPQQL